MRPAGRVAELGSLGHIARVKKFPYLAFALLAVLEFVLVFQFIFGPASGNTARVSYRRKERAAAMMAYG